MAESAPGESEQYRGRHVRPTEVNVRAGTERYQPRHERLLAEQPLDSGDSLADELGDATEAERLHELEVEHARVMVRQAAERSLVEARREPSELEDRTFDHEMAGHEKIDDSAGHGYSVFRLHRDLAPRVDEPRPRPLVLMLGLVSSAQRGDGRDVVHEFYTHVQDREIIVIEHEGAGESDSMPRQQDLAGMAGSRLAVLRNLKVEAFDIAGYSLGATIGLEMAAQAGDKVGLVTTIQPEGFEDHSKRQQMQMVRRYARQEKQDLDEKVSGGVIGPEVMARARAAKGRGEPARLGLVGSLKQQVGKWRSVRRQVKSSLEGAPMASAVERLDPQTQWVDITGSKDVFTDWQQHLSAIRQRNSQSGQRNSELLSIAGGTHRSVKAERAVMAEMVAKTLQRSGGARAVAHVEGVSSGGVSLPSVRVGHELSGAQADWRPQVEASESAEPDEEQES